MNRFLKYWRRSGKGKQYQAVIVNYADDFVILSREHAEEARVDRRGDDEDRADPERGEDERPGCLTGDLQLSWLHVRTATVLEEWPMVWYTAAKPSEKSITKLKQSVYDLLQPSQVCPWEDVRDALNVKLRGWRGYFSYGSINKAYREIDAYVY